MAFPLGVGLKGHIALHITPVWICPCDSCIPTGSG